MSSWKTSLVGIVMVAQMVITALYYEIDGNPETIPDWNNVVTVLVAATGFLFARDNNVTSEKANAK